MTSALAAVVGVTLTFALLRRFAGNTKPQVARSMEELTAEYGRWEASSLVPLFVCVGAMTYLWYRAIAIVVADLGPVPSGEAYLVVPEVEFWLIPAFFLGIISAAVPVDFLYRALLRDRYEEYNAWQQLKHGFDTGRVFMYLALLVIVGSGAWIALGLDSYVRFTESEVVVNPLRTWGEERHYSYNRVRAIEERSFFRAPIGSVKRQRHHALVFTDGTEWRTIDEMREPRISTDREIMHYVAQLTGKIIVEVELGGRDQK